MRLITSNRLTALFLKNVGNQTVDGSHWFPWYEKNVMQYNTMATMNCLVSNNLQNIVFCVQQREIPFNVTKKTFTSSVLAPDLLPVYFTSVFSTVHHWFYANDALLGEIWFAIGLSKWYFLVKSPNILHGNSKLSLFFCQSTSVFIDHLITNNLIIISCSFSFSAVLIRRLR